MGNFVIKQIRAYSYEEAKEMASDLFQVNKNATQKWKNEGEPVLGTPEMEEFCKEYAKNEFKGAANLGACIVIKKGVPSTKQKPYRIENIKSEGKRKLKRCTIGIIEGTNEIAYIVDGTKDDVAKRVAKFYEENPDFKGKILNTIFKQVTEGEPLSSIVHYAPSKGTTEGLYLVFGVTK